MTYNELIHELELVLRLEGGNLRKDIAEIIYCAKKYKPEKSNGLNKALKEAFNKHRLPPSEMSDRYNIGWDDCQSYIENIVEDYK